VCACTADADLRRQQRQHRRGLILPGNDTFAAFDAGQEAGTQTPVARIRLQ